MRWSLLVLVAACGAGQHARPAPPSDGSIAGLARDHDSGEPLAKAEVHLRAQGDFQPVVTVTSKDGQFGLAHLKPGKYSLVALFAGQQVNVENIEVRVGDPTVVDVTFLLGQPDPVSVDFNDAKAGEIDHFKPSHHAPDTALIEGTVNDTMTRSRVVGAVVTAVGPAGPESTLQVVSDNQGRYRFDPVIPGIYSVSAYYSIGGRGQVEVRRSQIHVAAAEGVLVPLWVETQQ